MADGGGLVLLGGGGHAKVVLDCWCAMGGGRGDGDAMGRVRVFDDSEAVAVCGSAWGADVSHAGSIDEAFAWLGSGDGGAGCGVHVAVGSLSVRRGLIERLRGSMAGAAGCATVVHPSAVVSRWAGVGRGALVGPASVINAGAHVEDHAIVNSGAIVEHDVSVGENAHVAPGATVCGGVRIGRDVLVGAGATLIPGVRVNAGAVVGAGAVVVGDVEAGVTVVGAPARVLIGGASRVPAASATQS